MDTFSDWLTEVAADQVVIAPSDLGAEARGNQWSFALTSRQAAVLSPAHVASFVRAVAAARGRLLSERGAAPMLFSCWHDDQASQLRFSLVSASHDRLPFHCEVDQSATLESIAASFLDSPYHDGFALSSAFDTDANGEGDAVRVLPVWVVTLPSTAV